MYGQSWIQAEHWMICLFILFLGFWGHRALFLATAASGPGVSVSFPSNSSKKQAAFDILFWTIILVSENNRTHTSPPPF